MSLTQWLKDSSENTPKEWGGGKDRAKFLPRIRNPFEIENHILYQNSISLALNFFINKEDL